MTFSDPLLKELKGHIIALVGRDYQSNPYGDDNETVFLLCHCLESIFLKGLVRYDGFTPWKADCFQWFYQIVRKYQKTIPLVFKTSFEDVLNDKKVKTHVGKTRLLIRTCLRRKCLHVPLQFHVENKDFHDTTLRVSFRRDASILGHEILAEIFLSLLLQLSIYDFQLDLNNSSFLDESWQIPACIQQIMVPCDKFGLTLGFPMGYPVIVGILEHSAAAELGDRIAIGDILIEINGIYLRDEYGSKIDALFKKVRSQPFRVTIIKGRNPKTSQVYLPIIKLYRILGLNPPDTDYIQEGQNHMTDNPHAEENSMVAEKPPLATAGQEPILLDLECGDSSASSMSACLTQLIDQPLMACELYDEKHHATDKGTLDKIDPGSQQQVLGNIENMEGSTARQQDKWDNKTSSSIPGNSQVIGTEDSSYPTGHMKQAPVISKFYGEDGDQFIV